MTSPGYVIVSPTRDEAKNIALTIASVAAQTLRPLRWVIVDDGSRDHTWELVSAAAAAHPWITAVRREDRGFRKAGGGVMDAFYEGYAVVEKEPWDYVVKLDADLSFGADYFERCLAAFAADPKLGVAGGLVCVERAGQVVIEYHDPVFHVRGPCKIYRRACWEQIGGLIRAPGWDTFDHIKANRLGWSTRTFEDLKVIHHRATGTAYPAWSNWTKNGLANYVVGYHPIFMFLKCARRAVRKPYGLAAAGLMWGFLGGYLKGYPQVDDRETIRYIRKQQINYLLGRKSLW